MAIASKPRVRQDLDVVELDDELVLYDPVRDEVHYLNSAAAIVFQLCDGSATVREMAGEIARPLGIPEKRIERQVRTLLKELRKVGLLEGSLELIQAPKPPPDPAATEPPRSAEAAEHEHEHDEREHIREQKTENS
jgi:PqqD family protein of HPr-rel-A system